jgi:hypothetical protein
MVIRLIQQRISRGTGVDQPRQQMAQVIASRIEERGTFQNGSRLRCTDFQQAARSSFNPGTPPGSR